ncbi:MAG TPA: ABC transporter permease [Bryobacteraceae bacterium]|jgi:putative ABC transport system permease protein|nr:ABC transporter permease [Bryobacteraceae bacterium]
MLTDLLFRLRTLFRRKAVEEELDAELRFHFERQVEKYRKSGLTHDRALRRARIEFGGLESVKEECREAHGVQLLESTFQDVRYGLRTLRKSPGFASVAMLTLALGIGANTAIFSVVYAVLLNPLPYKDSSRLIVLNETTPKVGMVSVSYPNFLDWRAQNRVFSRMADVHGMGFNLAGITEPESISGEAVSPNYLSMLGMHPFLGRDFMASEEKTGTAPVVLLSYGLWQSHFGGDRNALGRTITLNGRGFTIIGVLPQDFRSLEKADVIEPIGVWVTNNSEASDRGQRGDSLVAGRLAPGVSFGRARAEMEGIEARLAHEYPGANDQFGVSLRPIRDVFVGDIRSAILVLFCAVIFVLLIACANVANLFLMRGAGRSREIAVRMAIGATRGRAVRQMLVESFLLAFFGGLLGLVLAVAGIHGVVSMIPVDTLAGANVTLNGAVLIFAGCVVVISAFLFGLAPALRATKASVHFHLKEGGRNATGGVGPTRWRAALAVMEIALALVLLAGAGLMMKSLYRLLSVDLGIRPERVLSMEMSLRTSQYDKDPAILNFWQQVLDGVRALPGVEASALGTGVPLTREHSRDDITIEGMALPKPGSFPHPDIHAVSPRYVATLGIQLLRGRVFTDADRENAPQVAMINAMLAEHFFHNESPVGRRIHLGRPSPTEPPKWMTIVGVVGDTKLYGLANPSRLEVYVPFRQWASSEMQLIVKSRVDPAALISAIRHVVASVDKDQPIFAIATMEQLVDDSVSTRRITLILLGLFSVLALVLAAIGIYGVISYAVAQRTHEIGIRLALGAQSKDVVRMILAQGATITGAGVVIGIIAALGLTRLMSKLLFAVSAADPSTFAAVAIMLMLIAMVACYIPARRTLRVDPMIALRDE